MSPAPTSWSSTTGRIGKGERLTSRLWGKSSQLLYYSIGDDITQAQLDHIRPFVTACRSHGFFNHNFYQYSHIFYLICKTIKPKKERNVYPLLIYRYPLVDGTFFLSPRQYNKSCVQVKYEGKVHYLTAVCMGCLEAWPGHAVLCRSCLKPWAGGHLILGTMYSYDIFAAMPCCAERLKVGQRVIFSQK